MNTEEKDALVRITIEIAPTHEKSTVKKFRKVMEFHVVAADLPLKVKAHSARVVRQSMILAEEMCED